MLQQTRVVAAIPYYERFLERFPTVESLAEAPPQEVLRLWAGLGYYSRARNLQKAAQEIVAKHHGVFPQTEEQALALPGIGAYTAAAILSIAYGKKLAVLDGNVARVLARLGAVTGDLRSNGRWSQLQQSADTLLDQRSPGDWNQALMELGATLCTPRSPQCLLCPVAELCEARKLGLASSIPEKRKKRDTVEIVLASLVLADPKGRTLLLPPPKSREKSTARTSPRFRSTSTRNSNYANTHRNFSPLSPNSISFRPQKLVTPSLSTASHSCLSSLESLNSLASPPLNLFPSPTSPPSPSPT
jgi:A/G-specific adenine glycosylase